MSFQKPDQLWLLLALVVPLLLYLLPMPRRRVMSTALFLWERFLQSEVLGRTSERFRRALGLALLAAAIAALVAAAAELSIGEPAVAARRLVVLIDASASMNARSPMVPATGTDGLPAAQRSESNLERAKRAAAGVVDSLDARTEVAVAEAAGQLRLISNFQPAGRDAASVISSIEPFDGSTDLTQLMDQAFDLWGEQEECEIYVFTDAPLPENRWGRRVHAWIAPAAGDNGAIVALEAGRRGRTIVARFTLANYGRAPQTLAGTIWVNGRPHGTFPIVLGPGETSQQETTIDEPAAATLGIRLDIPPDALAADDEAWIRVPGLEDLHVRIAWPPGGKHNAYVSAALRSLEEQGSIGQIVQALESDTDSPEVRLASLAHDAPLTVFVNHAPEVWPDGGAIVLHPLRGGAVAVSGLSPEPITVTRQASHPLLEGVELRGLTVKDAVHVEPPAWAEPIVWAGDLPLVWAGETSARRGSPDPADKLLAHPGKTKVLIVALPLTAGDSQLPLLASFPVLLGNACAWMLPQPRVLRPGETLDGWTSRRAGLVENPDDGEPYAFSTLSPAESDLRREEILDEEPIPGRQSLALMLVGLATVLLAFEWGLFHRRFTE